MAASTPSKDTDETPDQAPVLQGEAPTSSLEELLDKHGKKIAFLLLAVLAVVGATLFMRTKSRLAQKKANEAFTSAATRDDLKSVADQYSGTNAGGNALLMLAGRQLAAGKDEDARISLTQFVKGYDKSPLHSNGVFALATLNEKMGKIDEAETGFRSITSNGAADPLASFASVRLGDLLTNSGKLEEAKDIYTKFAATYPGAPMLAEMPGSGFWNAIEGRELLIDHKITLRDHPAPAPEPEPEKKPEADPKPAVGGTTPPPAGGTTPPPAGGNTPPPAGGNTPPPAGGNTPPPAGGITIPATGQITAPPTGSIPVPVDGGGVKLEEITIPAPTTPTEGTEGAAGTIKAAVETAAEKAVNAGGEKVDLKGAAEKAADLKGAVEKAASGAAEAVKEVAP